MDLATQSINAGLFIVPDEILDDRYARNDLMIGNYAGSTREELSDIEHQVRSMTADVLSRYGIEREADDNLGEIRLTINTKIDIASASIGLGAIIAFLGLYIGLVFLIACGAILALKELSGSVDSIVG